MKVEEGHGAEPATTVPPRAVRNGSCTTSREARLILTPENSTETTGKKVDAAYSPQGRLGELRLASGKNVSMRLQPGDSWLVPKGARHHYRVIERFEAVEATSPPAHAHGRDEPPA